MTSNKKLARRRDFPHFHRGHFDVYRNNFAPMNIIENDNVYLIEMELPGWDKKDVQMEIDNDTLKIFGDASSETEESGTVHLKEFHTKRFYRSVILNEEVKKEEIKAELENGILTVELKKYSKEERPGYKKVEVL